MNQISALNNPYGVDMLLNKETKLNQTSSLLTLRIAVQIVAH